MDIGKKEVVALLALVSLVTVLALAVFGGGGGSGGTVGVGVQSVKAASVLSWMRPNGDGNREGWKDGGSVRFRRGDVDGNGVIEKRDAERLGRMIGGNEGVTGEADVNGDGRVDSRDISTVEALTEQDEGRGGEGDVSGTGTLQFAGYSWTTRSGGGDPGDNQWNAENAWVDGSGYLHLRISGGECAEVETVQSLGYGTYTWTVGGEVVGLNKSVVLGLFNYGDGDGDEEIDVEVSRWGNSSWPNGNYTVWSDGRAQERAFELGEGEQVFQFVWSEDGVSFGTNGTNTWIVSGDFGWGPLPAFMNLWLYGGNRSATAEVKILNFAFVGEGEGVVGGERDGVTVASTGSDGAGDGVSMEGGIRALYVWDAYYDVLTAAEEQDRFFRTCESANINTVWFLTGNENQLDSLRFFADGGDLYERFIGRANGLGIQVHALFGSAIGRDVFEGNCLYKYVMAILKYNADHPGAQFAGMHFDIENVGAGGYGDDDVFYKKYVGFVRGLKGWSYDGQTVGSQGMILSLYQDLWPGRHVSEECWWALVKEFDLVCLQSYGDTLESVVAKEEGCLSLGRAEMLEQEGIPFTILLETGHASSNVTFMDEGRTALEGVEAGLDGVFAGNSEYAGIGLHNYSNSIRAWYS